MISLIMIISKVNINYNKTTKIFIVTIPANSRFANLSVQIDDDSKNENSGVDYGKGIT